MMNNKIKSFFVLATTALLVSCASNTNNAPKAGSVASAKPVRAHVHVVESRPEPEEYLVPREFLPLPGERTVDDVLYSYAPYAVNQLTPYFKQAGVAYPPKEVNLIAFKEERKLEVWAKDRNHGKFRFIRAYDIKAASGKAGPKLRQGDKQVPEGVYRIVRLNPNSNFHLSMKLNYPNEFDQFHASRDGRLEPGSDIFIHGDAVSAGCLAMGDASIEELFVLAAHVGMENMKVVIAPHDPRTRPLDSDAADLPSWTGELYEEIAGEVQAISGSGAVKVSSSRPLQGSDREIR
jgi:hypothetical protein